MVIFNCHCEKCGIDFVSHKTQRALCNMCSTNGEKTKTTVCKKCGKEFQIGRNPNDENKFYKKTICPDCSGKHCKKCGKLLQQTELNNAYCTDCQNKNKHVCSKCGIEIEVENILGTNKYLPKDKKRKLCDNCYEEFLKETKTIICKHCGKEFIVGRSKVDGGFLLKDYCTDCYNKLYHPEYKIKMCKKCNKEFKIYPNKNGKFTEHRQYCDDCLPLALKEGHNKTCLEKYGVDYSCLLPQCQEAQGIKESKINQKFIKMLNDNNIKTESEWYDNINHRHYDIYLPEQDILIEINPSYTHSILGSHYNGHSVNADKMKWLHYYRTKDIDKRVIHVWDWDDWNKILQLVKIKQKLYARNLQIDVVNEQDTKNFLNMYHIQGNCRGKEINFGLYQNSELVQIMAFGKPRYNKNYQWELLRLCSHENYMIVGGAEKLFNYFLQNYQPESVISYCDISKFTGYVYERLGFKRFKQSSPSKHWSKGDVHITDSLLRQRGYDQLFKTNYGKGTSNEELMLQNGWLPVYDCGQETYTWQKGEK